MGYYHIRLTDCASKLFMIILPGGKDHYKRITMVVSNLTDILQHKMNNLFRVFEFIHE